MWYAYAKSNESSVEVSRKIKKIIRQSPFFIKLFNKYGIPIEKIEDVVFKIMDLRGKHAQSNSEEIDLNTKLFENGDFFKNNLHFVVHEIVHWLIRQREKDHYFSDPEEHDAFVSAMAYQISNGADKQCVYNTFFPMIEDHFRDRENAVRLFSQLYQNAIKDLQSTEKGEVNEKDFRCE